jgi:hypothetical protein
MYLLALPSGAYWVWDPRLASCGCRQTTTSATDAFPHSAKQDPSRGTSAEPVLPTSLHDRRRKPKHPRSTPGWTLSNILDNPDVFEAEILNGDAGPVEEEQDEDKPAVEQGYCIECECEWLGYVSSLSLAENSGVTRTACEAALRNVRGRPLRLVFPGSAPKGQP